jgi:HK97 family phage portal protein
MYQRDGDTRKKLDNDLNTLIHTAPNPYMASGPFREALQDSALRYGNGYAEIERARNEKPIALWPIPAQMVTPKFTDDKKLVYEIRNSKGQTKTLEAEDMFHLRGFGPNGIVGYSIIRLARESIGFGLASEKFGAAFFGNDARPAIALTHPAVLSDKAHKNIKDSFDEEFKGPSNSWKPKILEDGLDIKVIGVPPEDAQYLETRKFQVTEIARWYRVPPHKIAHLENATFSNIEHQSVEFATDSIQPWVTRWEQEADRKLLKNPTPNLYTKMNMNSLMRGDMKTRGAYYKMMSNVGAYSPNRILELEDENGLGPDGDIHLVPMNMTPIEVMKHRSENPESEPAKAPNRNTAQLTAAHAGIFESITARLKKKEINAVTKALKKHSDETPLSEWAYDFYRSHRMHLIDDLMPPASALAMLSGSANDDSVKRTVSAWVYETVDESLVAVAARDPERISGGDITELMARIVMNALMSLEATHDEE